MRPQHAFSTSVFDASKGAPTEILVLKNDYPVQGTWNVPGKFAHMSSSFRGGVGIKAMVKELLRMLGPCKSYNQGPLDAPFLNGLFSTRFSTSKMAP